MARTRKVHLYESIQASIKDTAWRHIAAGGAASLSLRAIARDMDLTAPALYTYFPDRDALVTALIIDAYTDFGNSQLAARDSVADDDLAGRLLATGRAYREWAVTHPERFRLIFGTPIPGYCMPVEAVMPAAARSLTALVSVVEGLRAAGRLRLDAAVPVASARSPEFDLWQAFGGKVAMQSFATAIVIWSRVHGLVVLEVDGKLPPFGPSAEELYTHELRNIARQYIQGDDDEDAHSRRCTGS